MEIILNEYMQEIGINEEWTSLVIGNRHEKESMTKLNPPLCSILFLYFLSSYLQKDKKGLCNF